MPSASDHLAVAKANQEAIDWLLAGEKDFPAWVTTVAFYKALHLVDALLHQQFGAHGRNHRYRQQILKREHRFSAMYTHYRSLRGASEVARYLHDARSGTDYRTFTDYLPMAKVRSEILGHRLRQLERSVMRVLGSSRGPKRT